MQIAGQLTVSNKMEEENYFIHEKARCESPNIGKNTRIWGFTHVMKNAVIGANVNIGENCFIENDVVVGDDVVIKNGISLWDGINIEDRVFLGPHMVFTNDLFPRAKVFHDAVIRTTIQFGASVGANATIICGNTLGKFSMVGAGSVVTKNVPDYAMVYGNPAKLHGYICECTRKLEFENNQAQCNCGLCYELDGKICKKSK